MKKGKTETIDMFGPDNVLAQSKKDTMDKAWLKGCDCPVCGQFVKVYLRTITSTMAHQMIHAWRVFGVGQWFHLSHVVMGGTGAGDFAKLEYWGLVEHQHHEAGKDGKRMGGMWRITERGAEFIQGNVTVRSHVAVYNGKALDFKGDQITVRDALGSRFDYKALMAPAGLPPSQGSQQERAGV